MAKHTNDGACAKCLEIIYRYPNPHRELTLWFVDFQKKHPEAHVSCAGRGRDDQEALFLRKASRARFGESAHNYGCAIDIFEMSGDKANIYESTWFANVLAPNIPDWIEWYGRPEYKSNRRKFFELPHCEVKSWRDLVKSGKVKAVE